MSEFLGGVLVILHFVGYLWVVMSVSQFNLYITRWVHTLPIQLLDRLPRQLGVVGGVIAILSGFMLMVRFGPFWIVWIPIAIGYVVLATVIEWYLTDA